jgi:Flp pilus assembly pilin Flp
VCREEREFPAPPRSGDASEAVPGTLPFQGGRGLVRQRRAGRWAVAGEDDGQALVEYALILLLVALVAIPVLSTIGLDLAAKFNDVSGAF